MSDEEQRRARDAYDVHHRIAARLEDEGVDPDAEFVASFVQAVSQEFAAMLAGVRAWPEGED